MSQKEPTEPYVYQPDQATSVEDKAWAVAGPGTRKYEGRRYTKAEAEMVLKQIQTSREIDDLVGGRRCPKCDGQMAHYRLHGWKCMRCC